MEPRPTELRGLEVATPPHTGLIESLGLRLDDLGERIIPREAIARHQAARDIGDVLQWQSPSGVRIVRRENDAGVALTNVAQAVDLCVAFPRGNRFDGSRQCALYALDGQLVHEDIVRLMSPEDVEALVVLTPPEAAHLFGTQGYGGAVMIYTRRGAR